MKDKIAETIKTYRILSGYTQEDLARECGVSRLTIYFWETGAHAPNPHSLKKLMEILKIRKSDFR